MEKDSFNSCSSIFNVGWVDNVQDYLSISHVMVFPSFREGFPVCIMESLSMGVPVITINSRGCNEIVLNQFNGYVTNPDDISIAKKMDEIACDVTLYSQLSTNALSIRDKYDRKLFTNNQYDIYKKLT
jgi:glycosyltransferase involved in cell wall biosynthesis